MTEDEFLPWEIERAAHALALDVTAADVVWAFESAGIPCIVLKGPAIAHWLYPDDSGQRAYTDVDLLVDLARFEVAEHVLEDRGFLRPVSAYRDHADAWSPESAWERPGSPPTSVDLHRGFHGVGDWEAFWTTMDENTITLEVAGRSVRIPDAAGCALITALHESAAARVEQSGIDLRRALARFDDDVWREAAHRSEAFQALPSLVLGLTLHEDGRPLVRRLGLAPAMPADVAIRSLVVSGADADRVERAWALQHRLGAVTGWRARIRIVLDMVFPSAEYFRATRRCARRGRLGLFAARVARPFALLTQTPKVLWLVLRGRRQARLNNRRAS
ncbi:MAG: nucleotidyltransferase family protein [Aeromicrobium sp.]